MVNSMTSFEEIYQRFFNKIENDRDFFVYFNVTDDEAIEIAQKRAKDFLIESVTRLTLSCTPDVDFHDYSLEYDQFNFDLTGNEIELLSSLMREEYFKRDMSKLKAFMNHFSTRDLNLFSPANERKTFIDMVDKIIEENDNKIKKYISIDRLTGKYKAINYAAYNK